MQRRALGVLFLAISISIGAIAVYSAFSGGRALVIAVAAGGLALWMADLARKAWRR